MTKKTLLDFADEHAPAPMSCWKQARDAHQLRTLNGDEDPDNSLDPGYVADQAEGDVEAALLPLFESGRYAIEGRREGTEERLSSRAMNQQWLRLALNSCGVIEVDHKGRTVNAWSNCVVIELAAPAPAAATGSESRGESLYRRIREWKAANYPNGTAKRQGQLVTECAKALGLNSLDARTYRRAMGGK